MQDIRRQFQQTSAVFLRKALDELQTDGEVSGQFFRELFRRIHTIKGTAQTFGLTASAHLAHELENVLSAGENHLNSDENIKNILIEGINFLLPALEYPDFSVPPSFIEKVRAAAPQTSELKGVYLALVPPETFDQLTEFEKVKLASAMDARKNIYCLEAVFRLENFTEELQSLQNILSEISDLIFTLPSEKEIGQNEIGFQIFISGTVEAEKLKEATGTYNAEIIFQTAPAAFSNDLSGILSQIVGQGKDWARRLGKQTSIHILSDEPDLSAEDLQLIFDILLHLVRNAVDHSIEKSGHIEIRLKETGGGLQLTVSDDGRGIDRHVIRAKAVERKLILPDTVLSEQETLELIFLPGFSTAQKVTELSGRGIGLDVVRDSVVNANGTISVESKAGAGATFEIFLPLKNR